MSRPSNDRLISDLEHLMQCSACKNVSVEARAKITELREALTAMLDLHGIPHRDEWLNESAYQHAVEIDRRARAAL